MYVNINGSIIDSNKVETAQRSGSSVTIYFKDGHSKWLWLASDREAISAIDKIADAMNANVRTISAGGGTITDDRIAAVDAAQKALAEKRAELERQKAVEDSSAAIGALLVGGICAIADAISSRKAKSADADKKRRR